MGARPPTTTDAPGWDEHLRGLIRHKAGRLIRSGDYRYGERKDLEQAMALHWATRLPGYDASRATLRTYADRALASKAADLSRHAHAKKRERRRERPIDTGIPGRELEDLRERAWLAERVDQCIDLRDALADLPDDAREVAALLTTFTVSEVVRRTGLSRQRVRTIVLRIGRHLVERGLP